MPEVKIYTTSTCPYCNRSRSFQSRDVLRSRRVVARGGAHGSG